MGNYRTFGTALDRVFRNDLNNNFKDIATDIEAQKTRVDNLITGTQQPSEVVDARGGKAVLKDRLDVVDSSLSEKATKTDLDLKRDKSSLITMNDVAQDIKTAMTGGSVAVVGIGAAGFVNLSSQLQNDVGDWVTQTLTTNLHSYDDKSGIATESTSAFYQNAIIPVSVGERYKISTRLSNTAVYGYVFADDAMAVKGKGLQGTGSTVITTDLELTVPSGATKLIINIESTTIAPTAKKLVYTTIAKKSYVDSSVSTSVGAVDNKVTNINNMLAPIQNDVWEWTVQPITLNAHGYDDKSGIATLSTSIYYQNVIVPVLSGEQYKISTQLSNASVYGYIFTDDSMNIKGEGLKGTGSTVIYTDYAVTVPTGATKLIINIESTTLSPTVKKFAYASLAKKSFVDGINTKVTTMNNALYYYQKVTIATYTGKVYNGKVGETAVQADSAYWSSASVDVLAGENYQITSMVNNSGQYVVRFCDSNGVILSRLLQGTGANVYYTDYVVTIPNGTSKMYINSNDANYVPSVKKYVPINAQDINDRISNINTNDTSLPDYYNSYISNLRDKIDDQMCTTPNSDAFIFITDSHLSSNTLNSFPVMQYLLKNTSIDKVFFNGDVIPAYATKADVYKYAKLNRDLYKTLTPYGKVFLNRGNHDFTAKDSANATTGFTADDNFSYNYLARIQEENAKCKIGKMYWYYDNPTQKIRYIGVDTTQNVNAGETNPWSVGYGMKQDQIDWLVNEALKVETGWNVVVFAHVPIDVNVLYNEHTILLAFASILEGFRNKTSVNVNANGNVVNVDFSTYPGDLVACFSGHNHKDLNGITNNVLNITTTSDAYYSDGGYPRTLGTVNEIAFDVIFVDKANRNIKMIRVGAGNDRSFTY